MFTFGNNDSGALGRETTNNQMAKVPRMVDIESRVDIISAGESHCMIGNSSTGIMHFWGKLRSNEKILKRENTPVKIDNYYFTRKGVSDIKSGLNHILVLSGSRVYPFGDLTIGALGNVFKREKDRCDFKNPTSINLRNIKSIFTGGYTSFVLTHNGKKNIKKGSCYAFGLNNYQQLGFESEESKNYIENLPVKWTEFNSD